MLGRLRFALAGLAAVGGGIGAGQLGDSAEPSEVVFLAVGQGDCTVIRHGGATILVDAGPATDEFDAGARIVAPKLRAMGIGRIDLVLLTHPDRDHVGGLPGLAKRIPIDRIAVSSAFRSSAELRESLQAAGVMPAHVQWISGDMQIRSEGMHLFVRPPKKLEGDSDNEGSLFLNLRLPGLSAVLTGDAGEEVEILQAGRGNWRADVLKAGHHGSGGSTSGIWLEEVRPRSVVVSCGTANPFGHPSPATLARIQSAGAKTRRTDLEGDIRFVGRSGWAASNDSKQRAGGAR